MAGPAFAQDIKPLFREKDRNSMIGRYVDLFEQWIADGMAE